MANYQFSSDLVSDILFRSGEPTDGSSDFNAVALQYLNRAYQALWLGGTEIDSSINENWWWLLTEAPLIIEPTIVVGTVTTTNGSASITFSSAPPNTVVGYFFRGSSSPQETYKIATHTAASTAATLDSVYLGTGGAGQTYTLFKMEHALATDVLRLATPMRLSQSNSAGSSYSRAGRNYQILGLSNRELEESTPIATATVAAIPKFFAQMTEGSVTTVRFDVYTSTRIRADYMYLKRPADLTNSGTEEALTPRQYRKLLADIAVLFLFIDKNDNRAQLIAQIAKSGVRAMALENRMRLQVYGNKLAGLAPLPLVQLQTEIPRRMMAGNAVDTSIPDVQTGQNQ